MRQFRCSWFQKHNKQIGAVNLNDTKYKTPTQTFIDIYKKLDNQYKGTAPEEQICSEAFELFKREKQIKVEAGQSLSNAFREVSNPKVNVNVDVKDLFKE